uniref:Transmembrane protein n=1 Tax=Neospora caninum (strain Liverpool) TaxID=572307 RepID=A0A0F7UCG2_NEOCL|nr:TPA: hypothetical protein BN1204_033330 [Neospora caninum Liverpool]
MANHNSIRCVERRAAASRWPYTASCEEQTADVSFSPVSASRGFPSPLRSLRARDQRSRRHLICFGSLAVLACSILSLLSSSPSSPSVQLVSAGSALHGDLSSPSSSSFLPDDGRAPPRRLQAGVYFDEEDRARKGQIYLWVSLTLVGLLVLVILYMLKIGSVFDPLLHTRFTPSDKTR